jgi:hypothetical protein
MLSYVLRKIQSDILGVGGATIFEVKSVTIIPSLPYVRFWTRNQWKRMKFLHILVFLNK